MSRRPAAIAIVATALALAVAACDSGGGPLHRPDVSPDRIVGAAVATLVARAVPGAGGEVAILDRLDPATIEGRSGLPERIREQIPEWATDRSTGELTRGVRDEIAAALPGWTVRFLPVEPVPLAPSDPRCGSGESGTFVRLALLPGLAVHGDVYLVVSETGDFCGGLFWAAARMIWQPSGLVGGDWIVTEVIGGAVTS